MSVIQIPSRYIYGEPEYSPIIDNEIVGISMTKNKITGVCSNIYEKSYILLDEDDNYDLTSLPKGAKIISKDNRNYLRFIDSYDLGDKYTDNKNTLDTSNPKFVVIIFITTKDNSLSGASKIIDYGTNNQDINNFNFDEMYATVELIVPSSKSIHKGFFAFNIDFSSIENAFPKKVYQIKISIANNIYSNETSTYVSGDSNNTFNLETNELVQYDTQINGISIADINAQKILEEYKNGKQVISFRCCVHNMNDENGNKVIDIKGDKKLLHIGDYICPYKPTQNGDIPYGQNLDGTAKTFRVVSHELLFDGGIWQQITAQEVTTE